MKKVQVLFIIVLAIILLISACGTKTVTTTTAATTAPVTTTAAPVTTSKAPTTSTTAVTTAPPATQTTAPTTSATTVATVQPVSGGTFTFLHNAGLPTLGSIAEAANAITLRSTLPVFETLLRIDPTGKLIPWLADSWTISADGKTVTFKLHPGIKFSDGTVFDAAAVKYNLEAALKGGVRGSAVLKKITLYEIIDPLTLKLTLSQYDATLLQRLGSTAIGQMGSPTAMAKATTPENQAKITWSAPDLSCLTAGSATTS
jgi:peptide/nickel transport system substrate-binding protein